MAPGRNGWIPPRLKKSPYLNSVVDTFKANTRVTLVRLLRLAPGAVVKEHTDPTLGLEQHKSVIRLTIPIVTNDEVKFFLNNELVPMKPGECWYLRPHRPPPHCQWQPNGKNQPDHRYGT